MAPNHVGDLLGSILGPMGSHSVKKRVKTVKNYNAPKIRISDYPAVIDFSQKMEFTVLRPNHGGDTLGAILGPIGSHWVQKNGSKRRKLPCPEILIFDNPAVIDYSQKMEVTVMAPNHDGDPLGAILGPMGSHWVQKMGQNVENYLAQNSNFRRPRGYGFFQKNGSYGYGAKSRWGPPRGHLGANGVPLGKKMGQNR